MVTMVSNTEHRGCGNRNNALLSPQHPNELGSGIDGNSWGKWELGALG